jgi:predicted nucleic acid-binding protein
LFLVDTNVLSAAAPAKSLQHVRFVHWMDQHSPALFLSVVTLAEIEAGIAKLRRDGAAKRAEALAAWLDTVLHLYRGRVLPVDTNVAQRLGGLIDHARGAGESPGWADLAIAATAATHGLTILTRNVRHFRLPGVAVSDPVAMLT